MKDDKNTEYGKLYLSVIQRGRAKQNNQGEKKEIGINCDDTMSMSKPIQAQPILRNQAVGSMSPVKPVPHVKIEAPALTKEVADALVKNVMVIESCLGSVGIPVKLTLINKALLSKIGSSKDIFNCDAKLVIDFMQSVMPGKIKMRIDQNHLLSEVIQVEEFRFCDLE